MVQARISNYLKNSDFTTQKQKSAYTLNLTVPAGTYSYGQTLSTEISVPEGAYFENVTLSTSLHAGENYPTNYAVVTGDGEWYLYLSVYQVSAGRYRLQATLLNPMGTTTTSGFTVTAKMHLSVSPFE